MNETNTIHLDLAITLPEDPQLARRIYQYLSPHSYSDQAKKLNVKLEEAIFVWLHKNCHNYDLSWLNVEVMVHRRARD